MNNKKLERINPYIKGMHCASCAQVITKALKAQPGVNEVEVNSVSEQADISYDPSIATPDKLNQALAKYGYSLAMPEMSADMPVDHEDHNHAYMMSDKAKLEELTKQKNKVFLSFPLALLMIVLMLWETAVIFWPNWPALPLPMELVQFLSWGIASIVLFGVGLDFVKAVGRWLTTFHANMDTLVGLGTVTAYLYSIASLLLGDTMGIFGLERAYYFDVTIVVISFVYLGKYLESRAKLKTSQALAKLIGLQAKTALVERDGVETEMPIESVVKGDVILIKPGAKIPLDGKIIEGSSAVDESMLTGEVMPQEKNVGDKLTGGTINSQGFLKMEVEKVGENTVLAQIINLVAKAQNSRAPIQRLVDTISQFFVPTVVGIALVSLAFWLIFGSSWLAGAEIVSMAVLTFVGVLVIACPCALGLATPTGIMVGVELASKNGILVKNAESLEKLGKIKIIILDKTGTITVGKPNLGKIHTWSDLSETEILTISASLEAMSEHPLAQAVTARATKDKIKLAKVQNFKALTGLGVQGQIDSQEYYLGSLSLLKDLKMTDDVSQQVAKIKGTVLCLNDGKKILGALEIADTIKPQAVSAIKELHQMGIKLVMLTGDRLSVAQAVANEVGIDEVVAEVMPAQKAQTIEKYKIQGLTAMVGDGVNDAPALAAANVGVAMSHGSDIAIESADITLLKGDLSKLIKAIKISRLTMSKIKQNLFWAFIYNVVAIPVAAGVLYPALGLLLNPAIAAGTMSLSSVSVVLNTLLMRRAKI